MESIIKMEEEILQKIGLSQAQSKIYLALLEIGSVKVGRIIEKTGLQSSTVHNCINQLIEKGFISYTVIGKIKAYQATSPEIIRDYLKEQEKDFENILPNLKEKHKLAEHQSKAEIFQGTQGIMNIK